ncbi:hypothetical protein K2173_004284 [Erythroxylum novogranatense]|uniref:MMS19 nucleotide excision repair protein n=1 Tax=Erythroxylum novogranatense TaxID=1862640 RepID=A0AAV8U5J3_9ROSI|nr:hypothetical protein K2173_004284 [Erythroxylum novogranatense]
MAEPSELTRHIESFVDSSRSQAQQAASLDAIVHLVKNDALFIGHLVKEMEMYLTTTDNIIRARGILLLGEVLTRLSSKPLDMANIHSLIRFFTERLADWRALRGAVVGCLALMRRKSGGTVTCSDAKAVVKSFLQNLQVQSLGQHDRKLCFELLECLLECYPKAVVSLGDDLVYGICEAIDGEKDPHCLVLTFHIVEVLVQLFPDPCGPIASFAGDLFSILGCYFPIHFTYPNTEDVDMKRDDLSRALMLAFSATPLFEPFAMRLLLEKLSSSLPTAKVDSLIYLGDCILKYGAERIEKHAGAIWSSLKEALYDSEEDPKLQLTSESRDGGNQIAREALSLLEKIIIQYDDMFLTLITHDEQINMILNNTTNYTSYDEIPMQSKKELLMVGRILYVSTKASISSCNVVFQSFFPRMMETMGLPVEIASESCNSDGNCAVRELHFGCFYICMELLVACRDLILVAEDTKKQFIPTTESYFCLLKQFSTSLSKIFSSILNRSINEADHDVFVHLGVKGLQTLATLPGGYGLILKSTFDNILLRLMSIIISDFGKTLLWKLALKALVHIGSFLHGCDDSEKILSYMDIVTEKIVSLLSSDDFSMPFSLKMEAVSVIGKSGLHYMMKITVKLEDIILIKLSECMIQGNLESAKIVLHILECYSKELLPWIQKNEGFEEVLLHLVVRIWNQVDNCRSLDVDTGGKDLLEAVIKVMKFAVAYCSVENQNIIVDKAYRILLSNPSLQLKGSLLTIHMKGFISTLEVDKLSSRDEWILSLLASVVIALRAQTLIPNLTTFVRLFMITMLEGYTIAAQALSSLVNKLDLMPNGALEEAMDIIFSRNFWGSYETSPERTGRMSHGNEIDLPNFLLGAAHSELLLNHAISGLAWIAKGLLMRGHDRVKDLTMIFLKCLLSEDRMDSFSLNEGSLENSSQQFASTSVMKCAADAFQIIMSDSGICLNRQFYATIRPLYKQRFFSTMMPIFQSLIIQSGSSLSRAMLHRAFAHIICDTPLLAILDSAKRLIPMVLDALTSLSKDVSDKDVLYSLLLIFSGVLTDKNGHEAIVENTSKIINSLIALSAYPHMMLVRETAIQCLAAMSELPHARIYPMRIQVLQAIVKALDDPKRAVRQEAVRCQHAWASIASRSLHF